MKTFFPTLGFGLALLVSLSACGRMAPDAPAAGGGNTANNSTNTISQNPLFQGQQAALGDRVSKAGCAAPIDFNKAPDGWTEVSLEGLRSDPSIGYFLVGHRGYAVEVMKDEQVYSGSVATTVEYDDNFQVKNVGLEVLCKDLSGKSADDQYELDLPAGPILAFNASTGQYGQRLKIQYALTPSEDKKEATPVDVTQKLDFFAGWRRTMGEQLPNGESLNVRFFKSPKGDQIEVRFGRAKPADSLGKSMVLFTALRYSGAQNKKAVK